MRCRHEQPDDPLEKLFFCVLQLVGENVVKHQHTHMRMAMDGPT